MILKVEKGRPISHSVENSLWRKLWTCRKTDCVVVVVVVVVMVMMKTTTTTTITMEMEMEMVILTL
jgi:hypothetical protein